MRLVPLTLVVAGAVGTMGIDAPGPRPDALVGWSTYAAATDRRVEAELHSGSKFLAQEFRPEAAEDAKAVRAGAMVVRHVETKDTQGHSIDVPSARVHHWRGAVLIPGLELESLLRSLQSDVPDMGQEDVLRAEVIGRGPDSMKVFLRVRRTKFVTVVYNTEHEVRFRHWTPTRASSSSTATKIAEIENPGTPNERELPAGSDRGFLWRWNAYWRYEQTPAGVIAECESLSLSRDVPSMLRYLVEPLVSSTARESMERTLTSMRTHFQK
jgi:hypothetical protein